MGRVINFDAWGKIKGKSCEYRKISEHIIMPKPAKHSEMSVPKFFVSTKITGLNELRWQ